MNWSIKASEHEIIASIAKRATKLAANNGALYLQRDALMDMTACHANGCTLKLNELLQADDGNFAHDVFGIRRHIDRKTGQLTDCFLPRYAA